MGVVIGSAVMPIAFSITWAKCSALAAVSGALVGLVGAVIAWVCTAQGLYGKVTIATLGSDYAMLAGNLVAICLSGIICVAISLVKPQNFDWAKMLEIALGEAAGVGEGVGALGRRAGRAQGGGLGGGCERAAGGPPCMRAKRATHRRA